MDFKIQNLTIKKIIAHQVYERDSTGQMRPLTYNDELTNLDVHGLTVLEERLVQSLSNNIASMPMKIDDYSNKSTFRYVVEALNNGDFITASKSIAENLAKSQTTRRIPGGVVVVIKGTVGIENYDFIGIIKAEMQKGFRVKPKDSKFILDFVSNVLLTSSQKFHKIGLYVQKVKSDVVETSDIIELLESTKDNYTCYVYDDSIKKVSFGNAANYFYNLFLGCDFLDTNKLLTKKFVVTTMEYIDKCNKLTNEEKINLNTALRSYIATETSQTISVDDFTEKYIRQDLKDEFKHTMSENKIPDYAIKKDTVLVEKVLAKRKFKFSSDVSIVVPSNSFEEVIEFVECSEGWSTIKIKGQIES